jgi:hypothetical protein
VFDRLGEGEAGRIERGQAVLAVVEDIVEGGKDNIVVEEEDNGMQNSAEGILLMVWEPATDPLVQAADLQWARKNVGIPSEEPCSYSGFSAAVCSSHFQSCAVDVHYP